MYALYRYRKNDFIEYPDGFAKIYTSKEAESRWLIIEEPLEEREIDKYDLIYLGHNMTYDRCISEIERTIRMGM